MGRPCSPASATSETGFRVSPIKWSPLHWAELRVFSNFFKIVFFLFKHYNFGRPDADAYFKIIKNRRLNEAWFAELVELSLSVQCNFLAMSSRHFIYYVPGLRSWVFWILPNNHYNWSIFWTQKNAINKFWRCSLKHYCTSLYDCLIDVNEVLRQSARQK